MEPQRKITNGARMAGEERRLQILRVAMRLFSQRGFRGTTTKEIALAAAVCDAMVDVREFIGMIIHHSLNNNLWDRQRQLLKVSNETAAREFTSILLHGVRSDQIEPKTKAAARENRRASRKTPGRKRSKK